MPIDEQFQRELIEQVRAERWSQLQNALQGLPADLQPLHHGPAGSWCEAALEPLLEQRREEARVSQGPARVYHDPIGDDPELGPKVLAAQRMAEAKFRRGGFGMCHVVWQTQQRILEDEFGVIWFTPAQMNPTKYFD